MNQPVSSLNKAIESRIQNHLAFIADQPEDKKAKCYKNVPHGFKVKTKQETAIRIDEIKNVKCSNGVYRCVYQKYSADTKMTERME